MSDVDTMIAQLNEMVARSKDSAESLVLAEAINMIGA